MADKKYIQRVIPIPRQYRPDEREAIAFEILKYIRERTDKGKDKNGESFPSYSPSYKNSLEFKIAGKSKTAPVNLRLSGDMMAAMDLIKNEPGKLVIGYRPGDPEAGRAEGNIRGTYGQSSGSSKKKRDFLGISPKVLREEILSKFPLDDKEALKEQTKQTLEIIQATEEDG